MEQFFQAEGTMDVFLIRHTTPDVAAGVCYGHTDLDTTETFEQEVGCILPHLPPDITKVYSSPLRRCRKLAERLFPHMPLHFDDRLKELNCGDWEMMLYDNIDRVLMEAWVKDCVNTVIPRGESYLQLYERAVEFFTSLDRSHEKIAVVTHAGVVRSLLTYVSGTPLKDSFGNFSLRYGCTVHLKKEKEGFAYEILHNPPSEKKERHRPSFY